MDSRINSVNKLILHTEDRNTRLKRKWYAIFSVIDCSSRDGQDFYAAGFVNTKVP